MQNLQLSERGATTTLRTIEFHIPDVFRQGTVEEDLVDYEIGGEQLAALERLIGEVRVRIRCSQPLYDWGLAIRDLVNLSDSGPG